MQTRTIPWHPAPQRQQHHTRHQGQGHKTGAPIQIQQHQRTHHRRQERDNIQHTTQKTVLARRLITLKIITNQGHRTDRAGTRAYTLHHAIGNQPLQRLHGKQQERREDKNQNAQ